MKAKIIEVKAKPSRCKMRTKIIYNYFSFFHFSEVANFTSLSEKEQLQNFQLNNW
ncbi:hypothetical protein [Candidatus Mycoplasma mahonii]|uniref:hypothetical protein n=1 Tax=Candidatus Mycoplasma mahonii TaxID=3004105 RepID=UPI0026F03D14|nr:hypothetical protein [Candidatus Mycoplasma mahonii]WKX02475.1 hypothetical protein O3I44_00115 [Candidatus Mycoplasma mahonii]